MSKRVKKIPKKQLISIKKFLAEYINGPKYDGCLKLTHDVLAEHLHYHHIKVPRKLRFYEVKEEDLQFGKVIYVRDKAGKNIPYVNPLYKDPEVIFSDLDDLKKEDLEKTRQRLLRNELKQREKELAKEGLVETFNGDFVSFDELYYEHLEEMYKKPKKGKTLIYVNKTRIKCRKSDQK